MTGTDVFTLSVSKWNQSKNAQQGIHTHITGSIYVYYLYLFMCTAIFSPIHIVCLDGAHIFFKEHHSLGILPQNVNNKV